MTLSRASLLAAALLAGCTTAPAGEVGAGQARAVLPLPDGFRYPNGVALLPDGSLAVGSVTSGQVVRLDPDGTATTFAGETAEAFAGTALRLDAARGVLWAASPDFLGRPGPDGTPVRRAPRLVARDARTGRVLRSLAVPEGTFPNDLAVAPDGGLFVTDSFGGRVLRLAPGDSVLSTYAEGGSLQSDGEVGPAGIARAGDGTLVVGLFDDGRLLRVAPPAVPGARPVVTEVALPRRLEEPDGLAFEPGGTLLVIEGAADSGDGRLLRLTFDAGGRVSRLDTLASGLDSPVNLTLGPEGRTATVTESRIRPLLRPALGLPDPDRFWVRRIPLR